MTASITSGSYPRHARPASKPALARQLREAARHSLDS